MMENRPTKPPFMPVLIRGVVARTPQQLEALRKDMHQPIFRPLADTRRPVGPVRQIVPQQPKKPKTAP